MNRLVKAELLKLRTTRTFYATIAGVVALVVLGVSSAIATAGTSGSVFAAIGKWLSFGASASLIGSSDHGLLPAGAAALLLLGYAAAFIATGIRLTATRDVIA